MSNRISNDKKHYHKQLERLQKSPGVKGTSATSIIAEVGVNNEDVCNSICIGLLVWIKIKK
ncbi:MAG: hypothetical protein SOX26_05425 [Phocaeicola sp.]|nr:hypothetical protein [Phocaeicola sp.]